MPVCRPVLALAVSLLLTSAVLGQNRPPVAPLPSDPLELATGPTKVLDTPQLRALVLGLLEQARQNNGMHTAGSAPFDMRVSFTSLGQNRYTGAGDVEETWMSGKVWRWSAHLGDYSIDRIFYKGYAFDEKPAAPMPLRVRMARAAVFWPINGNFAPAYLRVATAKWDGDEVMCILRSRGPSDEELDTAEDADSANNLGRKWGEREYCIDPKSGLLRTYSEAPGVYAVYDYNDVTIHFHGRTLARQLSVVEGGSTVLKIHIDSIEDPHVTDANFFTPTAQMLAAGPQEVASGVLHFSQVAPAAGRTGVIQPIVVIATISHKGKVEEAETPPNSDASLSEAALSLVKHTTYAHASEGVHQRLVYINVKFVPGG
ncbi:MAG TPA: hypothetical protein VK763_11915 [Terriglobales bacterium]|jgi:hypothetical protein|nr:hypothetical protein [Terriglobales bacterium]